MTEFLLLAFTFLIAGVVAVPIATRLGLGSVLGYLLAGMALSPLLNWMGVDIISIQQFAEFGVVMMLFLVGLELEPKMLWNMRTRLVGLGGLQVVLTIAGVAAVAMAFGQSLTVSIAIGFIMTLSSTAIVLQTLNEKGLTKSEGGQGSFVVLLFQDIAVIPMLAIIPLLALPELVAASAGGAEGEGEQAATLSLVADLAAWQAALVTAAAIAAVILMGNYLTRPLFRYIARAGLRELFVAAALMIVVGIALLMTLVGLSPALGVFLAGVVLANSEYRHELESDIDPFRGLLLGLFFMTVGAAINFNLLAENFGLLVALTVILMLVKVAVMWGVGVLFKIRGSDRWLMALSVAQAGEFGFVLIAFSVASFAISVETAAMLSLIVAMSMLFTPLLFIIHDKLIAKHFVDEQDREHDEMDEDKPIIIAGRGRIGGIVDRMLTAAGYETTVIDFSSRQLDVLRVFGVDKVFYGDATRPDLLHAAGIEKAKLLVIALDGREDITRLVKYMIQTHPHVHITARAVDRHHVYELWEAGCRDIIRETFDSSIRMGRSAFEALGHETLRAQAMADEFQTIDREALRELADAYDTSIPATENEAYIRRVTETANERRQELAERVQRAARGEPALPDAASVEAKDEDGPAKPAQP